MSDLFLIWKCKRGGQPHASHDIPLLGFQMLFSDEYVLGNKLGTGRNLFRSFRGKIRFWMKSKSNGNSGSKLERFTLKTANSARTRCFILDWVHFENRICNFGSDWYFYLRIGKFANKFWRNCWHCCGVLYSTRPWSDPYTWPDNWCVVL